MAVTGEPNMLSLIHEQHVRVKRSLPGCVWSVTDDLLCTNTLKCTLADQIVTFFDLQ